ncbi:MAG: hypothetical protein IPG67_16845 [Acidobacteria bacterium]|nr:hypothetical protein [Acidobacteriota bacterium]
MIAKDLVYGMQQGMCSLGAFYEYKTNAKNAPKVSDAKKVAVLVDKRIGLDTVVAVAKHHKISTNHVYKIERTASPAVLAKVEAVVTNWLSDWQGVRDKALVAIEDRLGDGEEIPLNQLSSTFATLYDKHALETDRPTSRAEHLVSADQHALDFFALLLTKMDRQSALEYLGKADLKPLVSDGTRDRIVLQLTSGTVEEVAAPNLMHYM